MHFFGSTANRPRYVLVLLTDSPLACVMPPIGSGKAKTCWLLDWTSFNWLHGAYKSSYLPGPWPKPAWRSYRSRRLWLDGGPVQLRRDLQRGPRFCLSSPTFSSLSDFIFQLMQGIELCLQMASKEFPWRRKAPSCHRASFCMLFCSQSSCLAAADRKGLRLGTGDLTELYVAHWTKL